MVAKFCSKINLFLKDMSKTFYFKKRAVNKVFLLSIIYTLVCVNNGAPIKPKKTTVQNDTRRLAVQVLRSAREFILKEPKQEIENVIMQKTSKKYTNHEQAKDYIQKPVPWFTLLSNRIKKKRYRTRRRRHKRGARVNHDESLISRYPTNRRLYKLVNRLGYFVRIHFNGTIDGTFEKNDPKTILIFESHGPSILRIKGVSSGNYLTMNQRGVPSAAPTAKLFQSLFRLTHEENAWDTYASFKYYFEEKYDMLIGLTKGASVKSPWKASPGQSATQFQTIPYI